MKKALFIAMTMILMAACTPAGGPQDHYTIKGTIVDADMEGKDVYLIRTQPEVTVVDSTTVVNNSFTFTGDASEPFDAYITVFTEIGNLPIFLENSDYEATIGQVVSEGTVTGGETQQIIHELAELDKNLREKYQIDSLRKSLILDYKNMTDEQLKANVITNKAYEEEYNEGYERIVTSKGLTWYNLKEILPLYGVVSTDSLDKRLEPFRNDPKFQGKAYFKDFEDKLAALKALNNGQKAPDFKMKNMLRQEVRFSEAIQGNKLTLIQFWASWTKSTPQDNATLVKLYNKYQGKGFNIFGVAFEKDFDEWKQAVDAAGIKWTQVSDLTYWAGPVKELYQVQFVPYYVLVDEEGKIIEKGIRLKNLEAMIVENL